VEISASASAGSRTHGHKDRKQFPLHLELIALSRSKGGQNKVGGKKKNETWLIISKALQNKTASMWGETWIYCLFTSVCVWRRSIIKLRVNDAALWCWCPKITSSAEGHKHTNKHKGTGLSVKVVINPEGENITRVCCSGKENVYFSILDILTMLSCQWTEHGVWGFSRCTRYDGLLADVEQRQRFKSLHSGPKSGLTRPKSRLTSFSS